MENYCTAEGREANGCRAFISRLQQQHREGFETSLECVAVEVWTGSGSIKVVNFYNPCERLDAVGLDGLVGQIGEMCVWVGDFNAHNPLWGSERVDHNGKVVEDFLDRNDYVVLNDGRPTRYNILSNTLSIELSFATSNLARVGEWDVMDRYSMGSDHYLIYCRFGRRLTVEIEELGIRHNFSRANWGEFMRIASELVGEVCSDGSINDWNSSLGEVLHRVARGAVPVKLGPKPRVLVPWWSAECDAAVRNRNQAYRRLRRHPTVEHAVAYKKFRGVARRVIKEAKKGSWRRFCGTLGPETPVGDLWSAVHWMAGRYRKRAVPVLVAGGVEAVTNLEKANILVDAFRAVHSSEGLGEENIKKRRELLAGNQCKLGWSKDDGRPINVYFSLKELKDAIAVEANTSPGRDGLAYEMFKHLEEGVLVELLALMETAWEEGRLPAEWKHAMIVPILKPGKVGSDPSSYRPIALTSVLCKIMERMVTNRLVYFLESKGHLTEFQNGFRLDRSTMELAVALDQDVKKAFVNKEAVVGVFLDIEKAYDSLWKEGLLIKLYDLGVRGRMFNWISDFSRDRMIQVRVGGSAPRRWELRTVLLRGVL